MDADFIFHLNYDPMNPHEIKSTQAMLKKYYKDFGEVSNLRKALTGMGKEVPERTEMTLLNRPIAAKLYQALYGSRQLTTFATD